MVDRAEIKPIAEADIMAMEAQGIMREVVDGKWVTEGPEMTGKRHGKIEAILIHFLMAFILPRKLEHVYPGDTTFVLKGTPEQADLIRLPDVSFVAAGRDDDANPNAPHYLAPDIAIEIISPSERFSDIRAKLEDYLQSGVRQVIPERGEVVVNFQDGRVLTYSGGDVLPGFELTASDIFPD
jgi:Uma2 family endonuclease